MLSSATPYRGARGHLVIYGKGGIVFETEMSSLSMGAQTHMAINATTSTPLVKLLTAVSVPGETCPQLHHRAAVGRRKAAELSQEN